MNRSRASSGTLRLAVESMPALGDHHEFLDAVGGLEDLHDEDDRGGLGPIALPAAYLEERDQYGRPAGRR